MGKRLVDMLSCARDDLLTWDSDSSGQGTGLRFCISVGLLTNVRLLVKTHILISKTPIFLTPPPRLLTSTLPPESIVLCLLP